MALDFKECRWSRGVSQDDVRALPLPAACRRASSRPTTSRCWPRGRRPSVDLAAWRFTLSHGPRPLASWSWAEFQALPRTLWQGDIHCVTTWSKFDTRWEGVSIDDLLAAAGVAPPSAFVLALSHDDYDTNLPLADLVGGRAMVATHFDGQPLDGRAWRAGAAAGAAPVLLEERQVAQGPALHGARRGRLLGAARLPHAGRPVEAAALLGRSVSRGPRTGRKP